MVQEKRVASFVGYIVLVGVGSALANFLTNWLFALSGERMTERLRKQSFEAIARQEISYFDDEKNGVGFLSARLAQDASLVKGVSKL